MKISTKSRYAVRLLLELAKAQDETQPITLKRIAQNQGISANYIQSISLKLTGAGYIMSFKGVGGGYKLARDPKDISVGDIMRLMESTYFEVHCVDRAESECPNFDACKIAKAWELLEAKMSEVVDSVSIYDLAQD